jgi:hypothetical protein
VVVFPLSATIFAHQCTTFVRYYFLVWACFALYSLVSLIFIGHFQRRYFGSVTEPEEDEIPQTLI